MTYNSNTGCYYVLINEPNYYSKLLENKYRKTHFVKAIILFQIFSFAGDILIDLFVKPHIVGLSQARIISKQRPPHTLCI